MKQCKEIRVVDRFNTSWGLVLMVKDDGNDYRVGENVCADGVCYTITGIHMSPSPNSDLIGLRVEKVMDENEDKCLDDDGWYLGNIDLTKFVTLADCQRDGPADTSE